MINFIDGNILLHSVWESESRRNNNKTSHNISKASSKDSEISSDSGPEVGIKRNREEVFKQPKTRPQKSSQQ